MIDEINERLRRLRVHSGGKAEFVIVLGNAGAALLEHELEKKIQQSSGARESVSVVRDNVRVGDCPVVLDEDQEATFCVVRIDNLRL